MTDGIKQPIAVAANEYQKWGCPNCGYRSGYSPISGGGTAIVSCGECEVSFAVLADDVKKSAIGFGSFYPELQKHPREGIDSHGKPDKQPEGGGEFFWSRGIGLDSCTCFVCGTRDRDRMGHIYLNNIAAFVQCKASGQRIIQMFDKVANGALLDYRVHEPDRIQVKIGACDAHLPNLQLLDKLCNDGVITLDRVAAAVSLPN